MSTVSNQSAISRRQVWSAVASMAMCAAMLIASEFMPVGLLTPIASDLLASVGMAGQAIFYLGPLCCRDKPDHSFGDEPSRSTSCAGRTRGTDADVVGADRRGPQLRDVDGRSRASRRDSRRLLVACNRNDHATRARGIGAEGVRCSLYGQRRRGVVCGTIGSYLGSVIGWRGVFWALVPIVAINLVMLLVTLPSMKEPRVARRRRERACTPAAPACVVCNARRHADVCRRF